MTTFYPIPGFSGKSFKSATLVIPSVSLANLPQLAVDLLVTSLGLRRVGWIGRGDTVAPFAGLDEGGEIVTGGLEVYGRGSGDIFLVQQRSPTIKSRKDAHVELLRSFISAFDFSFTLILTSLDAANQDDAQLLTPHQRILPPSFSQSTSKPVINLETLLPPLSLSLSDEVQSVSKQSYPPFLPAAGLTRRLLSSLSATPGDPIQHGTVAAWCVEGDNRGDAHALVDVILKVLGIDDVAVKEPDSWKGLFGTVEGWSGGSGMDAELYG